MDITINLASRPYIDLRPILKTLRITMGVFFVLIIGLGVGVWYAHRYAEESKIRVRSLEAGIANVIAERQGYQAMMQRPENVHVLKETDELNPLFDAKAFSWTLVLEDLETALPAGVQVTGIEPVRAKDGNVTLHVRTHGPRDKSIELLRNLELSKRFLNPRIVGESADNSAASNQALAPVSISNMTELDLLAEYNVDAPDDFGPAPAAALGPTKKAVKGAAPGKVSAAPGKVNKVTILDKTHVGVTQPKPHSAPTTGGAK